MLKAIERFDPARQTAFSTFAVPTIAGEIKRHFRDRTWSVKVPRGAQEAVQRLTRAERELEGVLGRSPTTAEIAAALEVSIEEVLDARAAALARRTESLDRPHGDAGEDGSASSTSTRWRRPGFAAAEDAATLAHLLGYLDAREREVLRLRFEEDLMQVEIGRAHRLLADARLASAARSDRAARGHPRGADRLPRPLLIRRRVRGAS